MRARTGLLMTVALLAMPYTALADPARILFVRGADRSGGFLEANNDTGRTEQLADITNDQTFNGNHGWFELAQALRGDGFVVEQIEEPLLPTDPPTGQTEGGPVPFDAMDLSVYSVIVMGSNNAAYMPAQVDAIEGFVTDGGGVLFIADANFGDDWPDSSTSDQFFLDRFGWVVQQDRGTYSLRRDQGDFLAGGHPTLAGVDRFDGEGVSPIVVPSEDVEGVRTTLVVRARPGQQTRNNDSASGQGSSRPVGPNDAALAIAHAGCGRIAGHYDRNTFFNQNGAGTNINRFDNRAYALSLFRWLAFGVADRDDDRDVDAEDLHEQATDPLDVNSDASTDRADEACVVDLVRRGEVTDALSVR
ncbi:MAG: hypothetical protein AAGH64_05390 [Planctomycetota bacterium]